MTILMMMIIMMIIMLVTAVTYLRHSFLALSRLPCLPLRQTASPWKASWGLRFLLLPSAIALLVPCRNYRTPHYVSECAKPHPSPSTGWIVCVQFTNNQNNPSLPPSRLTIPGTDQCLSLAHTGHNRLLCSICPVRLKVRQILK